MINEEQIFTQGGEMNFFTEVVGCDHQVDCAQHGALNLVNTPSHFPAWSLVNPTRKDVLVIATNPGQQGVRFTNQYERIIKKPRNIEARNGELLEQLRKNTRMLFQEENDKFHGPLVRALAIIMDVPVGQVLDLIQFTNIVKCSTCCNFGVLWKEFKEYLVDKCIETFFKQELRLLSPRIIFLYFDKSTRDKVIRPRLERLLTEINLMNARMINILRPSRVQDDVDATAIQKARDQYRLR